MTWSGIYLHNTSAVLIESVTSLRFWFEGAGCGLLESIQCHWKKTNVANCVGGGEWTGAIVLLKIKKLLLKAKLNKNNTFSAIFVSIIFFLLFIICFQIPCIVLNLFHRLVSISMRFHNIPGIGVMWIGQKILILFIWMSIDFTAVKCDVLLYHLTFIQQKIISINFQFQIVHDFFYCSLPIFWPFFCFQIVSSFLCCFDFYWFFHNFFFVLFVDRFNKISMFL